MIKLGSYVKDKVTGFEGIATSRVQSITGCDSYWVTSSQRSPDGKSIVDGFDQSRLEVDTGKQPIAIFARRADDGGVPPG